VALRIGVDYTSAINQRAGIGRYTRDLIKAVAEIDKENDYLLFYARGRKARENGVEVSFPDNPNFHIKPVALSERTLTIAWHRFQVPLSVERLIGQVDVFHSPDYTLPPLGRSNGILTVHDLSFLLYAECHEKSLREFLERVVPRSVARSSMVLADSINTMNDLVCLLDVEPQRVDVVYPGVGDRFKRITDEEDLNRVKNKYNLHFPFILYVGTIEPRKNLGRLIQAYARLKTRRELDHKLVIGGGKGWLFDDVFQRAADLRMVEDLIFPGYIPDEDLPALYSLADAFLFPSLYEGFGLPPLEAMACGTPVITSNVSSLPEIVEGAGIMINPLDIDELAQAIENLLDDSALQRELSQKGIERAKTFNWRATAEKLLGLYQRMGQ
jgi:glycosyltransferase involved in cell wall biosynthesis